VEVLFIIIALVYSVWSEVNKKKQEENVDIDFSELSSLDDFFQGGTRKDSVTGKTADSGRSGKAAGGKKNKKTFAVADTGNTSAKAAATARRDREGINYDRLPEPSRRISGSHDESVTMESGNYDSTEILTGKTNYDRGSGVTQGANGVDGKADGRLPQSESAAGSHFSMDTNDLARAIIMSEVLQRYDLKRVFARIPDFNDKD
jgi:hypothetical protein